MATAALDEASRNAWCRENGAYPHDLAQWRQAATQALAEPEETGASPVETKAARRRIKDLERELRRKDSALAEDIPRLSAPCRPVRCAFPFLG